jgi:16S rRNA (uracil1498-N3)-methyltransferase
VEMGATRLQPVLTRHTQVARVNLDRMRANAIEAAEQCGILTLPDIAPPAPLDRALGEREPGRLLVFCDEDAQVRDPVAALRHAVAALERGPAGHEHPESESNATQIVCPLAVLIGPEGGFAAEERILLLGLPNVVRLALGPRILRADTAAVAALALVGAVLGDWRQVND